MRLLLLFLLGCAPKNDCVFDTGGADSRPPGEAWDEYGQCLADYAAEMCEQDRSADIPDDIDPDDASTYCEGWCDAGCWGEWVPGERACGCD